MSTTQDKNQGASPLPKGKRKRGMPLFKTVVNKDENNAVRDPTGQTDTSLQEMKKRLAEVPKKSAGSHHDKLAFEKKK